MAFNIFAFLSVLFFLLAVAAVIGYFIVVSQTKNIGVGDIVRTTFSATPPVLTTALFGVNGEYATASTYGYNYQEDATNALHCDMPKGVGTFSSWLSTGGQNYKNVPWASNSQLYVLQETCDNDADCALTNLQCGPGYITQNPTSNGGVNSNAPRSLWYTSYGNPAYFQCPGNSYCSVCEGAPPANAKPGTYCNSPAQKVGNCVSINQGSVSNGVTISYKCVQPYSSVTDKYCAVQLTPSVNAPPLQRFTSCTSLSNYANTVYTYTVNNATFTASCSENLPGRPFFCNYDGNPMCQPGQQCVTNWNSLSTGWCTPGGGCPNLQTATNVCSGSVYPNVAIKSQWIAEGTVTAKNSNGTYNIQWNRAQNTYPGIGPSAGWCNDGSSNCSASETPADYEDRTWIYSDCRFVLGDSYTTDSRHYSVSLALLGTSVSNPLGLSIFSTSDASFSSFNLQQLLYVSPTNTGAVQNNWSATNAAPYRRSAWNLQSVNVTQDKLEKIFFYSIHPMETTTQTVGWHELNYS
jgi:hypothetical protein